MIGVLNVAVVLAPTVDNCWLSNVIETFSYDVKLLPEILISVPTEPRVGDKVAVAGSGVAVGAIVGAIVGVGVSSISTERVG